MKDKTEYVEANKDIFLLLINKDSNGKKVKEFFKKKVLDNALCDEISEFNEIGSKLIVSGVIGVLVEWLENGLSVDSNKISDSLYQILLKV